MAVKMVDYDNFSDMTGWSNTGAWSASAGVAAHAGDASGNGIANRAMAATAVFFEWKFWMTSTSTSDWATFRVRGNASGQAYDSNNGPGMLMRSNNGNVDGSFDATGSSTPQYTHGAPASTNKVVLGLYLYSATEVRMYVNRRYVWQLTGCGDRGTNVRMAAYNGVGLRVEWFAAFDGIPDYYTHGVGDTLPAPSQMVVG